MAAYYYNTFGDLEIDDTCFDDMCAVCRWHVTGEDARTPFQDASFSCCANPYRDEDGMLIEEDGIICHANNTTPYMCRDFEPADDFRGIELCEMCRCRCGAKTAFRSIRDGIQGSCFQLAIA